MKISFVKNLSNKFETEFLNQEKTLIYISNFISEDELIYKKLENEISWRSDEVKVFGKLHKIPRLHAWYGDKGLTYTYSGLEMNPCRWTKTINYLKEFLNTNLNTNFNSMLANLYRTGNDSMGLHSDNEKELGINPTIAALSFGQERVIQFQRKDKTHKLTRLLESGSLLIMTGNSQDLWSHQIPKSKKITNPRISLTFRTISK